MSKIYLNGDELLKIFISEASDDYCVHLHVSTIQSILNSVKSIEIEDDSDFITNEERRRGGDENE